MAEKQAPQSSWLSVTQFYPALSGKGVGRTMTSRLSTGRKGALCQHRSHRHPQPLLLLPLGLPGILLQPHLAHSLTAFNLGKDLTFAQRSYATYCRLWCPPSTRAWPSIIPGHTVELGYFPCS